MISRCCKLPDVGAVRLDGIGHWKGESVTSRTLGKTCDTNTENELPAAQPLQPGPATAAAGPATGTSVSESQRRKHIIQQQ